MNALTAEIRLSGAFQAQPRIKTAVDGEGAVVFHDRTRFGLCRMCIASYEKYPDIETWLKLLPPTAAPLACRYTERVASQVFIGYLWIYYKIGR
jgi:hypothetical protein